MRFASTAILVELLLPGSVAVATTRSVARGVRIGVGSGVALAAALGEPAEPGAGQDARARDAAGPGVVAALDAVAAGSVVDGGATTAGVQDAIASIESATTARRITAG